MIEPRFDDSTPLDCGGCAEPTDVTCLIEGQQTPICSACLHDSTFVCPECQSRFWSCDGKRFYVSPALYCADCFKHKDDACHASWQARNDEHRDDFHRSRR